MPSLGRGPINLSWELSSSPLLSAVPDSSCTYQYTEKNLWRKHNEGFIKKTLKLLKTVGTTLVDFTHRCTLGLLSIFVCKLEEIPFTTRLKSRIWEGHLTAVVQWRLERSTLTPKITWRDKAKAALGKRKQTSASKQEMFYRLPAGWTHKTRRPNKLIFSKMPVLTCMRKVTWRQHVSKRLSVFLLSKLRASEVLQWKHTVA